MLRKLRLACVMAAALAVASAAMAADQVNVRFSWKLKGEYAHFYDAQAKGLYSKEGLSVRFGEGAGAQAAIGALMQGQEDLVVLPGIFALQAISKGMPLKIVALYVPVQPTSIISMPDNPVRTPKDMEGKSIAGSVGETGTTYLPAFCKANGIDCSKIKIVQMDIQARVPQFLAHKVDMISGQSTNDIPLLEAKVPTKFVILDEDKFGLHVPGQALVTTNDILAKKGDAIRKFLKATNEGIMDSKRDTNGAAQAMLKSWPGGPGVKVVAEQAKATLDAMHGSASHPLGYTDQATVKDALDLLKGSGEISSERPLSDYYTNDYLPK